MKKLFVKLRVCESKLPRSVMASGRGGEGLDEYFFYVCIGKKK
jgi:hypothetical protein